MSSVRAKIRRKYRKASDLLRDGDWSAVVEKTYQNVGNAVDPAVEVLGLSWDVAQYRTWQLRQLAGIVPSNMTRPFTLTDPGKGASRKNVLWIMLDALREDIFTEYLRRGGMGDLMGDSAYFSQAFAQGSWTYPSVFSFLTARFPFNCGVSKLRTAGGTLVSLCADFDDSSPTIFGILRENGYTVGSILDGWGYTIRNTAGQEHREDRYFEKNWGWIYGQDRRFLPLTEQRDATLAFIRNTAQEGPFMLFVRSLFTHSPYREIFKSSEYVTRLSERQWRFRLVEGFIRGLREFERVYLTSVMELLEQLGLKEETIIVICSDHGDMFWDVEDDLRAGPVDDEEIWRHQLEPYNGLIKVPLFIWGAGMSGVYRRPFRLMDIVPTLLDEVGIAYEPDDFDGSSVRQDEARPLYADSAGYGNGGVAFQAQGTKLLSSHRLGAAVYDISPEGYERLERRRGASGEVESMLEFVRTTSRYADTILDEEAAEHDEALYRRLKALGYIQ